MNREADVTPDDIFARCLAVTLAEEGGYSTDPDDPGNWTGAAVGKGVCKGTKYGISAAAFPNLDIAALTREQAAAIYQRDYWASIKGDQLPPALALCLFDAAVNSGVMTAVRWLQECVGVTPDGIMGPVTLAAIGDAPLSDLCAGFQAVRLRALPNEPRFLEGWKLRALRVTLAAGGMLDAG